MKKLHLFIVIMVVNQTTLVFGQYLSFHEGLKTTPIIEATPQRTFLNGENSFVEIGYNLSGATISETYAEGNEYQFLNIDGFAQLHQIGAPALPSRNEIIAMPENSVGRIIILNTEFHEYTGFNIHPALEPETDTKGATKPKFQKDELIYGKNEFFPPEIVEITEVLKSRETPLAVVQVRPVQFNPVTGKIRVYTEIKYRLEFDGGTKSFSSIAETNSLVYTNLLKRKVINSASIPNGIPYQNFNSKTGEKNYIIITHSHYLSQANELAIWKRQMGYTVEVVSQSSWTVEQVKTEIHDRYISWNPKPDYILIFGDHDGPYAVPAELSNEIRQHFTDLYYVCMEGDDYWPDMAHGRISASTVDNAQNIVDKIINYEKNPPTNSSFYENGLVLGEYQDEEPMNGFEDRRFILTSQNVFDYLVNHHGYDCTRVFDSSTIFPVPLLRYNNDLYSTGGLLPEDLRSVTFNWETSHTEITQQINNGKFLVVYRGHGFFHHWSKPDYDQFRMFDLTNDEMLPIVFSITCLTGAFEVDTCFAENFIGIQNKGAVGIIAASDTSFSGENDALALGLIDAIWPDPGLWGIYGTGGTGGTYHIGAGYEMYTLGDVLNQGFLAMALNWGGAIQYTCELFNYFGDPAMKIWTSNPTLTCTASHPFSIGPGATSMYISGLGVPDALATLVYDGQLIGETQLSGYSGWIYFDPFPDPDIDLTLTISKHNYRPYIATIDVSDYGLWTGSSNEDWDNAANWSGYTIPDYNTDVTIPNDLSVPHSPVIESSEAYCLNLFLEPGAIVTMNDYGYLHCYGNFNTNDGQFTMNSGHSYLYFKGFDNTHWRDDNGDDNYSNVYVIKNLATSSLELRHSATILGRFAISEGIFEMNNNQTLTVINPVSFAFEVEDGGQILMDESNECIEVAGDIHFYPGSQIDINDGLIQCGGDFVVDENASYNINLSGGRLSMNGDADQYIDFQDGYSFHVNDFTINKSGGICYLKSSNLDINGNLVIHNGSLSCEDGPAPTQTHLIQIAGNWTNHVGGAGFIQSNGRVVFNGGDYPQYISDESFNELELNKASGGCICMDGTHVVCNEFDWTAGVIYVLNDGSFTADDLYDDGIYGKWILDNGNITLYPFKDGKNDPESGPVDLNGEVHIYNGTMNISGTSSQWPGSEDALIEMSGGVLNFTDCGINIVDNNYTLTENITGGIIRTTGNFECGRNDYHPDGGTLEFYGSEDKFIYQIPGSTLYDIAINKSAKGGSPLLVNGQLSGEQGKSNTLTLSSDLVITNDLVINAGSFIVPQSNGYAVRLRGDWINNVGNGAFIANTGTVIFEGTNDADIIGVQGFYNLILNKADTTYALQLNGNLSVENDLTIDGGTFISNDNTIDVYGNVMVKPGGVLLMEPGSALRLDDGSDISVSTGGELDILGEEANDAIFTHISTGTFCCTNAGIMRAQHAIFENICPEGYILADNGSFEMFGPVKFFSNLEIDGTLLSNNNVLSVLGNLSINSGGLLSMEPNSRLELEGGNGLSVSEGGKVMLTGEEGQDIIVSNYSSGYYSFGIFGTIDAKYTIFENMDANGIFIGATGLIGPDNPDYRFWKCLFRNGAPAPSTLVTLHNNQEFIWGDPHFENTDGLTGSNIRKILPMGQVTVVSPTGDFAGPEFEEEEPGNKANRIIWTDMNAKFDLKAMLEGPFNGTGMNTNITDILPINQPFNSNPSADWFYTGSETITEVPANAAEWVLVELRDATSAANATPGTMVAKQAALILDDGSIINCDTLDNLQFTVSYDEKLYAIVWTRNHLGVISANNLMRSGGKYVYDFTSGIGQALGGANGHKHLGNGIWGLRSGDGNGNGIIQPNDKAIWSLQAGNPGYLSGDYNLDGQVNNHDKNDLWFFNLTKQSQIPE